MGKKVKIKDLKKVIVGILMNKGWTEWLDKEFEGKTIDIDDVIQRLRDQKTTKYWMEDIISNYKMTAVAETWNDNGVIRIRRPYVEGKISGYVEYFDELGKTVYLSYYERNKEIWERYASESSEAFLERLCRDSLVEIKRGRRSIESLSNQILYVNFSVLMVSAALLVHILVENMFIFPVKNILP